MELCADDYPATAAGCVVGSAAAYLSTSESRLPGMVQHKGAERRVALPLDVFPEVGDRRTAIAQSGELH